ncbi:MAG: hypothetical protein V4505_15510 [Pseudomonadota bacterium]
MKMSRSAAALMVAVLCSSFATTAAYAFGEADAKAMCKQYVRNRLQKGDTVEWVGEPRWQTMDTATEKKWAVFMDFRAITMGTAVTKAKKAVCQGRYDGVSTNWKIVDYSER